MEEIAIKISNRHAVDPINLIKLSDKNYQIELINFIFVDL